MYLVWRNTFSFISLHTQAPAGKTGEPKPNRMVPLSFTNRYLVHQIQVTLQSNKEGVIELGSLDEIAALASVGVAGKIAQKNWNLRGDWTKQPSHIHSRRGDILRVAFSGNSISRESISFLERDRLGGILHDRFHEISLHDGFLVLGGPKNDLPCGHFTLTFRESDTTIDIRIVDGQLMPLGNQGSHVVSSGEAVEVRPNIPVQISSINVAGDDVKVHVCGGNPTTTRVHVLCTSFYPEYDVFNNLADLLDIQPGRASFAQRKQVGLLQNRAISDEYRYILDRRYAPKRAGNGLFF